MGHRAIALTFTSFYTSSYTSDYSYKIISRDLLSRDLLSRDLFILYKPSKSQISL